MAQGEGVSLWRQVIRNIRQYLYRKAAKKNLIIIAGPSCAGKSTFITSDVFQAMSAAAEDCKVLLSNRLRPALIQTSNKNYILHHNLSNIIIKQIKLGVDSNNFDYSLVENFWEYIFNSGYEIQSFILVCNKAVLLERVENRKFIEENLGCKNPYNKQYWKNIHTNTDFLPLYKEFIHFLKGNNISPSFVNSTNDKYDVISYQQCIELAGE